MASGSATPSSTIRIASRPRATPSRLLAKPGESFTTTSRLPRAWVHSSAARTVSSAVRSVTTTSTSAEAGTGLKKCMPRNRSGRFRAEASSVTDRELVLVASTVRSPTAFSAAANIRALRAASSGTASTTRSAPAGRSSTEAVTVTRSSTRAAGPSSLPRSSARRRPPATRSRAASAASRPLSTTTTSEPAVAKDWAMPAPMRPPPTTPTVLGAAAMPSPSVSSCPRAARGLRRTLPGPGRAGLSPAGRRRPYRVGVTPLDRRSGCWIT